MDEMSRMREGVKECYLTIEAECSTPRYHKLVEDHRQHVKGREGGHGEEQ